MSAEQGGPTPKEMQAEAARAAHATIAAAEVAQTPDPLQAIADQARPQDVMAIFKNETTPGGLKSTTLIDADKHFNPKDSARVYVNVYEQGSEDGGRGPNVAVDYTSAPVSETVSVRRWEDAPHGNQKQRQIVSELTGKRAERAKQILADRAQRALDDPDSTRDRKGDFVRPDKAA